MGENERNEIIEVEVIDNVAVEVELEKGILATARDIIKEEGPAMAIGALGVLVAIKTVKTVREKGPKLWDKLKAKKKTKEEELKTEEKKEEPSTEEKKEEPVAEPEKKDEANK